MKARLFLSVTIIAIALIMVLAPDRVTKKGEPRPRQLLQSLQETEQPIDADKAARIVNESDSNFRFIDVRSPGEFLSAMLPGAINIPMEELLAPQWQGYLKQDAKTNILYSNGDYQSNMAKALLNSLGYGNTLILKGGLNEWYARVVNIEFKGGRLTARENALFENRTRAKELFIQLNSLPDSLKNTYMEAKLLEEKKLDGGCE